MNPTSSEVLRQLEVKGPAPGEVDCAAGGKLSTVYFGGKETPGVMDQLTFASAFR